jgi:hypothetical protein
VHEVNLVSLEIYHLFVEKCLLVLSRLVSTSKSNINAPADVQLLTFDKFACTQKLFADVHAVKIA